MELGATNVAALKFYRYPWSPGINTVQACSTSPLSVPADSREADQYAHTHFPALIATDRYGIAIGPNGVQSSRWSSLGMILSAPELGIG